MLTKKFKILTVKKKKLASLMRSETNFKPDATKRGAIRIKTMRRP